MQRVLPPPGPHFFMWRSSDDTRRLHPVASAGSESDRGESGPHIFDVSGFGDADRLSTASVTDGIQRAARFASAARAFHSNEQTYSAMPFATVTSKPDFEGTRKYVPAP